MYLIILQKVFIKKVYHTYLHYQIAHNANESVFQNWKTG